MIKDLLYTDKMGFAAEEALHVIPTLCRETNEIHIESIKSFYLIKTNPKAIRQVSENVIVYKHRCYCDLKRQSVMFLHDMCCTADVCYGIIGAFLSSRLRRL